MFPVTFRIKKFLDNRIFKERFKKVILQFEEQVLHPPGGDPVIRECYKATLDLIKEDKTFKKNVDKVLRERGDLNEFHFVNLFFRCLQYIRLFVDKIPINNSQGSLLAKKEWGVYLKKLTSSVKKKELLNNLLLTRDTATTKYQRYISLYALINWFFPNRPVKVCDFGCGGNYGLKGIELGEDFDMVKDETTKKIFTRLLGEKVILKEGLGIDKENPDSLKSRNWRLACSLYPQEMDKLNEVLQFEQRLKQSIKVKFLKADLTKMEVTKFKSLKSDHRKAAPKNYFDLVVIYTTLYQIHDVSKRIEVLDRAKSCLKEHGLLVIQDFVQKRDDGSLDFTISWFDKPFSSYKTLMTSSDFDFRFLEVFSWENGRCLKVRDGKDLPILLKSYFSSTPKAAFAHSTS